MRIRKTVILEEIKNQIVDLFEHSPLSVSQIAKDYGVSRLSVYRLVWKKDGKLDSSRD